jgi:hypothetical protein
MRRLLIALTIFGALATAAPARAQVPGDYGYQAIPGQRPVPAHLAAPLPATLQDAIPGLELGTGEARWLRDGMAAGVQTWIPNSQWNGTGGGCSVRDYYVC